jgi:isochorismate hydrolase
MKETYFTRETLLQKSQEMLATVLEQRTRHNWKFTPGNSALLVLDMQNYFLKESSHAYIPSAPAIVPNIQKLIEMFIQRQQPLIFTRHINTKEDGKMMLRWWKNLISADDSESTIYDQVDTSGGMVIEKTQYDAFFQTNLDMLLQSKGIEKVVITGVMANLCCETTARSAFIRGYEVFFVIDGTAAYNEAVHRATILNLAHGFAIPVLASEIPLNK